MQGFSTQICMTVMVVLGLFPFSPSAKPLPGPPSFLETILGGPFSDRRHRIRTATCQADRKDRRSLTTIDLKFDRHPLPLFGGLPKPPLVSGELRITTRGANASDWKDFFRSITQIQGKLRIHDIETNHLRRIGVIHLVFSPQPDEITRITGNIGSLHQFTGFLKDGNWNTSLEFVGLQLEQVLPGTLGKTPLSVTGNLHVSLHREFSVVLTVRGLLARLPALFPGRPDVIIRNETPFSMGLSSRGFLVEDARFSLQGNPVTVNGTVSPNRLNLAVEGKMDVRRMNYLVPGMVLGIDGTGALRLVLGGSLARPVVTGHFSVPGANMTLADSQARMEMEGFRAQWLPGRIEVAATIRNDRKKPLAISGEILPGSLSLKSFRIQGDLPPEFLTHLLGKHVSELTGTGSVNVVLEGPLAKPSVSGLLRTRNMEFRIRGFSQNMVLRNGRFRLENNRIRVEKFDMGYEDGDLSLSGWLQFKPDIEFDLRIQGNALPFRMPGVFSAEFNTQLHLTGQPDNSQLTGKIDLITGKYTQQYDIIQRILTVHRFHERDKPLWHALPWFGDTRLTISLLNTGELEVANNIANLQLDGLLTLSGTVSDPRLQGQLTVNVGTFKIPFFRGQYDVDEGFINFDMASKPVLNILGTTAVKDLIGDEVLVKLQLVGPIDRIQFSLQSIPDMDQGQIVMLLASGRTTEDLRQQWQGSPRAGTGMGSTGFNPLEMYDEPIKQVTGDFLSMLVANPIKMVTKLDLFRLELGSDSFQVRMSKTFLRHITMKGEVEVGFLGRNRQEGGLEIKFFDQLSLEGMLRRYVPDVTQYEYEEPLKGRVQLRYRMKFRGSLKDVLGFW